MSIPGAWTSRLDRFFGMTAAGSCVRTEVRAGAATFLTMAYILFVNPQILGNAIPAGHDELMTATALAAIAGTLMMGLVAKYPFALAPGMGLNAYFVVIVTQQGIGWETALGAVFISGVVFLVLSVAGLREFVINAIPRSLKIATAAGIGLFLALIGAQHAGLVTADPITLLKLGPLNAPSVLLCLFGFILTATLLTRRIKGAMLIGIVATSGLAIVTGAAVYGPPGAPEAFAGFPAGIAALPVWPTHLFGQLDIAGALSEGLLVIVFVFLFVDLFDTAGTLFGLAEKSRFTDDEGRLPRASQAFAADAVATVTGALLGTSTTTTYIESAAGIEDGGRTGLTAVVVAACFALALFCSPLAAAVPQAATAPVLILLGAMMLENLRRITWEDPGTAIPVFVTVIAMPLTYSIANGIAFGIIAYTLVNLLAWRPKRVHWFMYVLTALLIARYAYLT